MSEGEQSRQREREILIHDLGQLARKRVEGNKSNSSFTTLSPEHSQSLRDFIKEKGYASAFNLEYLNGSLVNMRVEVTRRLLQTTTRLYLIFHRSLEPNIARRVELTVKANKAIIKNVDASTLPYPFWGPSLGYGEILRGPQLASAVELDIFKKAVKFSLEEE